MPNNAQEIPFRFLDVRDLCQLTGKARSSVYRDIENGALPKPVKIGGSTRWRSDQLVEFFDRMEGDHA